MIAAIMQPTYLPWMGYFDLIAQADVFVLLDNVQFAKRSWQQRNRIKTKYGMQWLTVPVEVSGRYHQLLRDASIHDASFAKKHLQAIRTHYTRAAYYEGGFPLLENELLRSAEGGRLMELNYALIAHFCSALGISTPMLIASEMGIDGKRSGLLAALCTAVKADTYLSAAGSAAYLLDETVEFKERGIQVLFHRYEHPTYTQLFPPFASHAAVVDLILNEGPRALEIICSGRRSCLSAEEMRALVHPPAKQDAPLEGRE